MNILIAPDKFKGSLSAAEAIQAIVLGLRSSGQRCQVRSQPLADGGEGSIDLFQSNATDWIALKVSDPLFRPVQARYLTDGGTAYIEMARASGLRFIRMDNGESCMETSSYGTGQLIEDALDRGYRDIVLYVGGSATTDLGIGMATALGYRFYNLLGHEVLPIGRNMNAIAHIDRSNVMKELFEACITVACDVDNGLYGLDGAAYQYAAQKGASHEQIEQLDKGLRHLSDVIERDLSREINDVPGAGSAGGMGGGALAFLNATLSSGIDLVMDHVRMNEQIQWADIVITGEGQVDRQSLSGKVLAGVKRYCDLYEKRMIVVCGINGLSDEEQGEMEVYDLLSKAANRDEAIHAAAALLTKLISEIRF